MIWLLSLLWGIYVGIGIGFGTFSIVTDDPFDSHWLGDVLVGVFLAFAWGPGLLSVFVEDLLR